MHPHHNDVLMGRGGKNNAHYGNKQLRKLARELAPSYYHTPRLEKQAIFQNLVSRVKQMNPPGRFLRQNKHTLLWTEVDEGQIRRKASQHLRDAAKEYEKGKWKNELVTVFDHAIIQPTPVEITPPSSRSRCESPFDVETLLKRIDWSVDSAISRISEDESIWDI